MAYTPHPSAQASPRRRLLRGLAMVLASVSVGGLIMAISNLIAGRDLAGRLASALGVGSGTVLGALLGALTGAWLVLGGVRRLARFTGFVCAASALPCSSGGPHKRTCGSSELCSRVLSDRARMNSRGLQCFSLSTSFSGW